MKGCIVAVCASAATDLAVPVRAGKAGIQGNLGALAAKGMAEPVIVGMVALVGLRVGKRIDRARLLLQILHKIPPPDSVDA